MNVAFVTYNDLGGACIEELHNLGATVSQVISRRREDELATQTDIGPLCEKLDLPLALVDSANSDRAKTLLTDAEPDVLFVVGWSELVDAEVLDIPRNTALGMHPTPLPRGRGRAPVPWTLIKGLSETSLSLFELAPAADAGDIVGQRQISIHLEDDAASLERKIVDAGPKLLREVYPDLSDGRAQNDELATWWPKRAPHHGLVDWTRNPMEIYNWIRGQTHPFPGAFSYLGDRKVTLWAAAPPEEGTVFCRPGEIVDVHEGSLIVGAWEDTIEVTRIEVDEDGERHAAALVDDYDVSVGDRFADARDRLR